ncbi:KdsC family phosphatase [Pseudoxanthomonas mexicana]|uniref:KdsC family phosphatase n=1 Tax=Pseudoxanthomonas mexicana TaxID=128785 RepID=UPI00398B283A
MPLSHLHDLDDDLLRRAARVRLACFDVDGTLTDGRIYLDSEGREIKAFNILDGQGLVLLRRHGIRVVLITARSGRAAELRAQELDVAIQSGVKDKRTAVGRLCAEMGIGLDEVSFMGDDLADLEAFKAVGLAVAPANAHAWTARHAHWHTRARGGEGAARELCDLLLGAHGHLPAILGDPA